MLKRKCIKRAIVELSDSDESASDDCVIVNKDHVTTAKKETSASKSGGRSTRLKRRTTEKGESPQITGDKTGKTRGTKEIRNSIKAKPESKVAVRGRKRKASEAQSEKMGSSNSTDNSAEKIKEKQRKKQEEEWQRQQLLEKHFREQKAREDAKLRESAEKWRNQELNQQSSQSGYGPSLIYPNLPAQPQFNPPQYAPPALYPQQMLQSPCAAPPLHVHQPIQQTFCPPQNYTHQMLQTQIYSQPAHQPPVQFNQPQFRQNPAGPQVSPPCPIPRSNPIAPPPKKVVPRARSKSRGPAIDQKSRNSMPLESETPESHMDRLGKSYVKFEEWTEIDYVQEENGISRNVAENIIKLLNEDNTIPFIARYRKDMTKGMDADALRCVQNSYETAKLIKRKANAIIKDIDTQGKWTPEFHAYVHRVRSLGDIEHIHSMFKVTKSTLSERARKLGLDVPARGIFNGERVRDLFHLVDSKTEGLKTGDQVKNGIIHILADTINKDERTIEKVKNLRKEYSMIIETAKIKTPDKDKNEEKKSNKQKIDENKYDLYHNFASSVENLKPHQVLAINRGESRKVLSVKVVVPDNFERSFKLHCGKQYQIPIRSSPLHKELFDSAIDYVWSKSIKAMIKRRTRQELNEKAEEASMDVFAENVKQLLLSPPVRGKVVMGVDPGFRHGCKLAVVSEQGDLLETETIYPHNQDNIGQKHEAECTIVRLAFRHKCTIFALGNGTACRETEVFLADLIKKGAFSPIEVVYSIVDETGASIYSCSKEAKTEFPDMDVNVVSAISIARRLQDPMAELVKIEPKHLGVGMYQHDLPEKPLAAKLNEVIMEAVSFVGVDINTASVSLLKRVAGLGDSKANTIIQWRKTSGPFRTRKDLLKIRGIGSKTFEQCAGFIRIMPETAVKNDVKLTQDSLDYLDQTWIHPESYDVARAFVKSVKCNPLQLGTRSFIFAIELYAKKGYEKLAKEFNTNVETMEIIIKGLSMEKGQDIRAKGDMSMFRKALTSFDDLSIGVQLTGVIRNITHFGAFIDVGIETNGLLHKKFTGGRILSIGDKVEVRVLSIEKERGRLGLSLV